MCALLEELDEGDEIEGWSLYRMMNGKMINLSSPLIYEAPIAELWVISLQ